MEIVENWNVVGMQGTGSHDLRVTDQFVAEDWTFVRGGASTVDERALSLSDHRLRGASACRGEPRSRARGARCRRTTWRAGARTTTWRTAARRPRAYYRIELAKAEAQLRSARAFFYESTDAGRQSILASSDVTLRASEPVAPVGHARSRVKARTW